MKLSSIVSDKSSIYFVSFRNRNDNTILNRVVITNLTNEDVEFYANAYSGLAAGYTFIEAIKLNEMPDLKFTEILFWL